MAVNNPSIALPLTPAPSTDITGKEHTYLLQHDVHGFNLPPSAMASRSSDSSEDNSTDRPKLTQGIMTPPSPAEQVAPVRSSVKRKTSTSHVARELVQPALPPPPTRHRKIIQMRPKLEAKKEVKKNQPPATKAQVDTTTAAGKKKQAGGSAGRKIARKTAHSIIERRRREKMNEEFGVLKDMIPACSGQEMHKLAILQVRPTMFT